MSFLNNLNNSLWIYTALNKHFSMLHSKVYRSWVSEDRACPSRSRNIKDWLCDFGQINGDDTSGWFQTSMRGEELC